MDFLTPQKIPEKHKTVISKPIPSTIFPGTEYRDDYCRMHPRDSQLWLKMFVKADEKHGRELCSILMFVRNTGAVLVPSREYGHIIQPVIGANGWESREQYDTERQVMSKYRAEIIELLKSLGR